MFAASRPCITKPFAPFPTGAFLFPIPALRLRAYSYTMFLLGELNGHRIHSQTIKSKVVRRIYS